MQGCKMGFLFFGASVDVFESGIFIVTDFHLRSTESTSAVTRVEFICERKLNLVDEVCMSAEFSKTQIQINNQGECHGQNEGYERHRIRGGA